MKMRHPSPLGASAAADHRSIEKARKGRIARGSRCVQARHAVVVRKRSVMRDRYDWHHDFAALHPGYDPPKKSNPRSEIRPYTPLAHPCWLTDRRRRDPDSWCGAVLRQRGLRWSAGRRSVRAASLANPPSQDARASGWVSQTRPQGAYTPRSQGACKGALAQRPGASRRSIPLPSEGRKTGRVCPHPADRAGEALAAAKRRKPDGRQGVIGMLHHVAAA